MWARTTLKCKWLSCHVVQRIHSPFNCVHSLLSTCAPVFFIQQLHGGGTGGQPVNVALLTIDISILLDKTQIAIQSNFSHFCKVKTTDKLVSESTRACMRVHVCACACVAILSLEKGWWIYLYQHFLWTLQLLGWEQDESITTAETLGRGGG